MTNVGIKVDDDASPEAGQKLGQGCGSWDECLEFLLEETPTVSRLIHLGTVQVLRGCIEIYGNHKEYIDTSKYESRPEVPWSKSAVKQYHFNMYGCYSVLLNL